MSRKITTEEWIAKAKEVHGDTYDYSESEYKGQKYNIKIICKKHGAFYQQAGNHVKQHQGCPLCSKYKRKTTEEFVEKANEVHSYKYDYSKVEYKNSKTKVCIICPEHGEFWQTPSNHLHGYGCMKCGGCSKLDTSDFIEKAKKIHDNKYSYEKTKYVDYKTKVIITCPIHGEFEQNPHDHLSGHGCSICGGCLKYTQEDFITLAHKVHGNKYSYEKTNYITSSEKVIITCPKHGDFTQTPASHLSGIGCPKCKRSRGEETVAHILDEFKVPYNEQFRIKLETEVRKEIIVDFFLPSKNIIIEYNGIQHYEPIKKFGGEETFIERQKRDNYLRNYCKIHKIQLIEIPYTETNIKNFLKELLL